MTPDLRRERQWWRRGHHLVAGVDEVGRGAWAGPVTVGAVVVACDIGRMPRRLRDSKQLPAEVREGIYDELVAWSTAWAVGHAGPDECDRLGMTAALRLAARRAFRELGRELLPDVVVLDGSFDYLSEPHDRPLFDVNSEPSVLDVNDVVGAVSGWVPTVQTVIGGDASCASVAAASVLAKVTRDRLMRDDAECYPAFEFDRNKGYPTRVHRRALNGYGMTAIHRRSWVFADDLPWLGRRVQRIAPGVPWAGCPPDTAEVRAFDMTEALTP